MSLLPDSGSRHLHRPGTLVKEWAEKGQPKYEYLCAEEGCGAVIIRNRQAASW